MISDKVELKAKSIKIYKEEHFIILKATIYNEDIAVTIFMNPIIIIIFIKQQPTENARRNRQTH